MPHAVTERRSVPRPRPTHSGGAGFGRKVILFNDDTHTFDEVAHQLMKAIRCSYHQGMAYAGQVHHQGSTVVYSGHLERCEAVAMVLEQIHLKVKVD